MNKETERFIKINKVGLEKMFQERLEELKESVFNMTTGEDRDTRIALVREQRTWLNKVKLLTGEGAKKDKEPDFI